VYVFLKCEEVLRPNYTILFYLSVLYYLLFAMTFCILQIVAICVPSEVLCEQQELISCLGLS